MAYAGDPPTLVSDSTKARRLLNWKPKFPALKELILCYRNLLAVEDMFKTTKSAAHHAADLPKKNRCRYPSVFQEIAPAPEPD